MPDTKADPGIVKICKICRMPASDTVVFGLHKYKLKDGFSYYERLTCRSCEAKSARDYSANNKNKIIKNKNKYREKNSGTIKYHAQEKISTWRKASNVPSDLTVDYLIDLYKNQGGLCYYSGEPMVFGWVNGKVHYNSLSLDKLDPNKGYVIGNVVWCSYYVNTMKQNLTKQEFLLFINKLLKHSENNMTDVTATDLLKISANTRLGKVKELVLELAKQAALNNEKKFSIGFHESETADYKFTTYFGRYFTDLYRKAQYNNGSWENMWSEIIKDLTLVCPTLKFESNELSGQNKLVLLLDVSWGE